MDNSNDKYLGQMLDSRYEILEVIGKGGMAVVYKALCHRLNRYVAIKILRDDLSADSELRRRFQAESQAVAMLSHPNIVSAYDFSRSGDVEYIVMELIEGITLKQYMQKKGALGWKEALHFATQITKALDHAHGRGIIHRDIKPHNIMVLKDGSVKVADFGIARLQDTQNTLTQGALGSVHYISPEQAKGEPVDARSDVYSTGVVLYEMLTGKLPFEGDSAVAVAIQHINSSPTQPREIAPDIPEELAGITMRAMNSDINERYESAAALLEDLEAFRKSQAVLAVGAATGKIPVPPPGPDDGQYAGGQRQYLIREDVPPISTSGEMKRESYERRRSRSKKVSMFTGLICVVVFIIAVFTFLWNFWIKDLFSEPQRITIPNFVGSNYEDITGSESLQEIYKFTVIHEINADVDEGIIFAQTPEADKSLMLVSEGIDVELKVSTGAVTVEVPNLINVEYRQAGQDLAALGLEVEFVPVASSTITKDYVVSTNPSAGTKLTAGSTVYVSVSSGPEILTVSVPDLYGQTQAAATALLENNNLTVGSVTSVDSDRPVGTVVWQSINAGEEVEEHTKVYIQISSGPRATPTPSTEPETTNASPPDVSTDAPVAQDPVEG